MSDDLDDRLIAVLQKHNAQTCASCGFEVGWGSIAWNNATSEAGTPCAVVYVICDRCGSNIALVFTWKPCIEDLDEVLSVLEEDWPLESSTTIDEILREAKT